MPAARGQVRCRGGPPHDVADGTAADGPDTASEVGLGRFRDLVVTCVILRPPSIGVRMITTMRPRTRP